MTRSATLRDESEQENSDLLRARVVKRVGEPLAVETIDPLVGQVEDQEPQEQHIVAYDRASAEHATTTSTLIRESSIEWLTQLGDDLLASGPATLVDSRLGG